MRGPSVARCLRTGPGSSPPRQTCCGVTAVVFAHCRAFGDRRFDPIAEHELPGLQCCVSLLVDYEGPLAWNDFEIKKHGIIIEEFDPTVDAYGQLIERVFMVLYDNGSGMHITGSGFLDLAVKAA